MNRTYEKSGLAFLVLKHVYACNPLSSRRCSKVKCINAVGLYFGDSSVASQESTNISSQCANSVMKQVLLFPRDKNIGQTFFQIARDGTSSLLYISYRITNCMQQKLF